MTVTPQPAPETATTALYRAALGPVNVGRYLSVFARFDEAGRAGPGWNWAAALLTLNWLVFRQLWVAALLYVAAVEGLVLLVLGLGREWLATPSLAQWGFLGTIFVLSCLVPGVYGTAWLHADTRRRMTRAVQEARTVREACAALALRASTRRRLLGLVLINGVLAVALAGAYGGLSRWVADTAAPHGVPPSATLPAEPAPAAPAEPVAPSLVPSPPSPVEASAVPASGPASPTPVQPTPAEPAPVVPPVPVPVPIAPPAPQAPPPPATPATPQAQPAASEGFAINVGLFADAANADRVFRRLQEAGLPAFIQVVDSPNGQRTRVRVGPFATRALADDAAVRIRAMGLEAVVFRQ